MVLPVKVAVNFFCVDAPQRSVFPSIFLWLYINDLLQIIVNFVYSFITLSILSFSSFSYEQEQEKQVSKYLKKSLRLKENILAYLEHGL